MTDSERIAALEARVEELSRMLQTVLELLQRSQGPPHMSYPLQPVPPVEPVKPVTVVPPKPPQGPLSLAG